MNKKLFIKIKEALIARLFLASSLLSVFVTLGIILILSYETFYFFKEVSIIDFFTDTEWTPLFVNKHFGILPLVSGTFLTTFIAILIAIPIGLTSAVYLSEYATPKTRNIIKPLMEIMAGVPTVVYGYFGLLFVTPFLKKIIPDLSGFNSLSAGIVMGIMIIPIISSLSEDAMHSVPIGLREGGYALGSSRLQVAFKIVVPSAFSGIIASFILGVSRAIGETMIVAIAAGQQPRLTLDPRVPIETITSYIVQVSMGDVPYETLEYRTIFVCGMTLFVITFILNIVSFKLKKRFREIYE